MKLVSFTTGTGKGNGNMAKSLIRARDGLHNVCCFQIHIWGFTHWPLAMQAYTCLSICKDTSLVPGNKLCYSSPVSLATICLIRLFTGLTGISRELWRSGVWQKPMILDVFSLRLWFGQNSHRCCLWSFPRWRGYLWSSLFSPSRQDY